VVGRVRQEREDQVNVRYTTQTAYERIRAYFSKKGAEFAMDPATGNCRYRTSEGRKCAVGCLVPDSLYDYVHENVPADDMLHELCDMSEEAFLMFEHVDEGFLVEAQTAHDYEAMGRTSELPGEYHDPSVAAFIEKLDVAARSAGLEVVA
jgi:hypothetical protein